MASPRVSAPLWDADGVLIGGTRWKPVSSVRLQRYGFEFDALVRGEAHERAEKRVSGGDAAPLLASLGASREALRHIWNLADTERGGSLRFDEFVIACYLAERQAQGQQPPESLEAFPLGTFPPRAEGALAPLVGLPAPPPKARVTEVCPFDLTEPGSFGSFGERASRRREEEASAAARVSPPKKFADPKRIEDLHAAAEKKAVALEAERARLERERRARETAECTFAPEKISEDVPSAETADATAATRAPLADRASGIVVARDQKRWLAGELKRREERDVFRASAEANRGVRVLDLSVDPAEFAETTARRWEDDRKARENALESKRAARALEEATPSVPRFVAPPVAGLEDATWNDDAAWREKREGPWHERLSRTETRLESAPPTSADGGPSPSPAARSVEALHAARALHVEAQLRERRRAADERAATKEAAETASAPKMSSGSFEAHAARARKRLIAVMRLARVLLEGDANAAEEGGEGSRDGETSRDTANESTANARTLPREAVSRVLRATKMLPTTVPESREAQRDEARKVYRLCAALREDVDASDEPASRRVSAVLVARFVGAGTQAGLERAGASFDEKASFRRASAEKAEKAEADDPDAGVFGAAFDAGRLAHATRQPWWPATFDDERAEAVRDAFESIAGARGARETLSRTPLGKKTKSEIGTPGDTARLSSAHARGTPASRLAKKKDGRSSDVAERLLSKRAAADAAVEAARAARDALEAAECTFQPRRVSRPTSSRPTSSRPRFSRSVSREAGDEARSERVFSPSRAARALRRSQETAGPAFAFSAVTGERVVKPPARTSREEAEARELAECTFAPRINKNSEFLAERRSTETDGSRSRASARRLSVGASSERRRRGDENAAARKPWEPREARGARNPAPPRRPAEAPHGFENTVRRMREANARAAARKSQTLGAVERRASWMDPREMRARLAAGTEARVKLSPGFRARARERRAAAVAKLKASRLKGSTNARAASSATTNDGALAGSAGPETGVNTPTPRPNVVVDGIDARISVPRVGSAPRVPAFLTPAKTATVSEEANRASPKRDVVSASSPRRSRSPDGRSSPETPFAFRVEDGSPPARLPATPSTFGSRASSARKSPAESSVEGAEFGSLRPRSGSPRSRSPRVPTPLAEAPPWSSSKSLGSPSLASPTGSARSRSPRSPAGVSSVPASARATLRMNKNAPSLSFSPGSAGSPSPGAGCSPSDGYPYTKFVLGPPLARIELTIGEARGKTSFLTFHANETADGAARRFCDANRLPNSTVPDVRAVLEEALRHNEIEIDHEADDAFQDELSPLFREKRAPTLADLAA